MVAARTLFVALAILSVGLAGCIGAKNGGKADVKLGNVTKTDTFTTPPDGRSGNISAFSETNKTETGAGGIAHTHDLWAGRSRVTIFQGRVSMDPTPNDQNQATTSFHIAQPGLVYEGTGSVEVSISDPQRKVCEGAFNLDGGPVCSDRVPGAPAQAPQAPDPTGGGTQFMLKYEHASSSTYLDAGSLTFGKPTVIKITDPKQTDMPHSTASLWQFQIISPNAYDNTLTFVVKVDIVRNPDFSIPLWPAHPNFYADKHTRDIFDGTAISVGTGTQSPTAPKEAGPVTPQRLISYGTRSLYVWANITDVTAPNPATAPTTWFLHHLNATGISNVTNPFDNANHSADKKNHFWILPVNDSDMDSPYQSTSRWQFELRAALTTPVITCYEGCADYQVKYTLVIKASDVVEDPSKYEIYCEDRTC